MRTFRTLCCEAMARVATPDRDGEPVVNINSIPGFTRISMYPKLWVAPRVDAARGARALARADREAQHAQPPRPLLAAPAGDRTGEEPVRGCGDRTGG